MEKIFNTIRQMVERIANIRLTMQGTLRKKEMRIDMRLILVAIFLILYTILRFRWLLCYGSSANLMREKKAVLCTGMCQGRL